MAGDRFHNKGLKYYCDQTEKDFEYTDNGYFCHLCHKNITDFRDKTKTEYERIVKETPGGCGIFYADQIGDEIEITLHWKKPFVIASFIASLIFSKKALAQSSAKPTVELTDSSRSAKSDTLVYVEKKTKEIVSKNASSNVKKVKGPKVHKKRLYLSRKFPFIHYRRRNVLGGSLFW